MIRPGSQNARLLDVLRRGPATNRQIHEQAGHMIVNSRVAELRAHGYEIECEHVGGHGAAAFVYTLVNDSSGEGAVSDSGRGRPASSTAPERGLDAQEPGTEAPVLAPTYSQLTLEDVAA